MSKMTYDEFIEKLDTSFQEVDWHVERSKFKSNDPIELVVVFKFPVDKHIVDEDDSDDV